ncbi:hypothetical protein C4565_08365 [Candidatus Parcubacteria bacterium]|nr:MAG: hypothetical protein C4565_08365 [Candidatus Parcubacteria bacterium]
MSGEEITVRGLKIYFDISPEGYVEISSDEILNSAEGQETLTAIKDALHSIQTDSDREWDTHPINGKLGHRNPRFWKSNQKLAIAEPPPPVKPLNVGPDIGPLEKTFEPVPMEKASFSPASWRERDLADAREANKEARVPWCDMLGKPVVVGLGDKNAGTVGRLNYVSCKYDSVPMGVISLYGWDGNILEGQTLTIEMKKLELYPTNTDKVFWIIGLSEDCKDEMGVEVNGVPHFYYKYAEAQATRNLVKDVDYRYIEKREFGEVIHKSEYRG